MAKDGLASLTVSLNNETFNITSETFAKAAEAKVLKSTQSGKSRKPFDGLTTTKIRSIYALIMNVYTQINSSADFESHKGDIQYIKVKMAYEAGRDRTVKNFIDNTLLMRLIDSIETYDQFLLYCRYAESLVAYFKFYGGRDK